MNEPREWIFYPLLTWPVLCHGGGLFRWQVGHISVAYFFFFLPLIFVFTSVLPNWSELAFVFGFSVKFGPTCLPLFSSHRPLVELLLLRHLRNHPVSLKIYAFLLIANSKSVLDIKSWRRPTSLYLKVIFGGIRAKHSASSLKVFIRNFCLPSNASLSWLGTSFFPRVRHLWIRCIKARIMPAVLNWNKSFK